MTLNAAHIPFHAAALHIRAPNVNLLEEIVDDLAKANKIPEEQFDLLEEFAEQLVQLLLDSRSETPGIDMFGDIVRPDLESPTFKSLYTKRDEFIGSFENCLEQLADEEEELIRNIDIDTDAQPKENEKFGEDPPEAELSDIDPDNEKSEAELMRDQIRIALHIFDDIKSEMTDKEQDELLNAALELDTIRKKKPLHVHYDRLNKRPS